MGSQFFNICVVWAAFDVAGNFMLAYFGVIQRVPKRVTRFQIIICNNENVLQLQNKLQTIK